MNTPRGGRTEFGFTFGKSASPARLEPDAPCAVLVLSDFSGRANRGLLEPLSSRRRLTITIDNQEKVYASLAAALELPRATGGKAAYRVPVETLDDLHPDSLLRKLDSLSGVFRAAYALRDPAQAKEAAEQLQLLLSTAGPGIVADAPAQAPAPGAPAPSETDADTLSRLLGQAAPAAPEGARRATPSAVDGLIRQAVESSSSVAPTAPAGIEGLQGAAELELSSRLRAVLHDPDFQSLEAAWRGLDFLLRRCPDEERVRYTILDVTLDELAADTDGLRRLLRDSPPQLIVADCIFGQSATDLEALGQLAALCAELGARFLGGADPRLAGCDGFDRHPDPEDWSEPLPPKVEQAWAALRASSGCGSVGLALPRFLLRQPYGSGSDSIDGFKFEEIADATNHSTFLWGNPAFLCAQFLVEAFVAEGQGLETGEVGELPVFRYKDQDGEGAMKPCAEAWLTERAAEKLLRQGFIPLLSIHGRDAVFLPGFVSISKADAPPAGD